MRFRNHRDGKADDCRHPYRHGPCQLHEFSPWGRTILPSVARVRPQHTDRFGLGFEFFQRVGNWSGVGTADQIQIEKIFEWRAMQRAALDFSEIDAAFGEWAE